MTRSSTLAWGLPLPMYSARGRAGSPRVQEQTGSPIRRGRFGSAVVGLLLLAVAGCSEQWSYYALNDVQAQMPGLSDRQWSKRREYSEAEMLAVQSGGAQTLLIARSSRPATRGDVAQLDEDVSHTFVIALDSPLKAGKTYKITPENGRLIEGTTFRPAWRPYRGIEGEVTVLGVSAGNVRAAVRVTALTLKQTEGMRELRGMFNFKTISPEDPVLRKAKLRLDGVAAVAEPVQTEK